MAAEVKSSVILIADDDPFIVSLYRERLMRMGHQVCTVQNGEDAIRRIQEDPPGLLLLDLNMPRLDGRQVLQFVRQQSSTPDLPVIVLSSACAAEAIESVNRFLPTRFLIKHQVSPKQVLEEIRTVLAEVAEQGAAKPVLAEVQVSEPAIPVPGVEGVAWVNDLESAANGEQRRDILLRIYRTMQEDLRTLKAANVLSLPFQFGEVLEQFFEAFYAEPDRISISAPSTLRRALPKLADWVGRNGEGLVTPEPLLLHSFEKEVRQGMLETCRRPGLQPIVTARVESQWDLVAENDFKTVVQHVRKLAAARKLVRYLESTDLTLKLRVLILVPGTDWAPCQADFQNKALQFQALPLMTSEMLLNLFLLMF